MIPRLVRLLHVEHDDAQRKLMRSLLDQLPPYRFAVTYAADENSAVETFRAGYDIVILDYSLPQSNGFSCLKRLRAIDSGVPLIVVLGESSPSIASDLLEAGADDSISKDSLDLQSLGERIQAALARGDAWRNRAPDLDPELTRRISSLFGDICSTFVERVGPHFANRLDDLESSAREAQLTNAQILRLFDAACDRLDRGKDSGRVKRLVRPIMLEVVHRLCSDAPEPALA